MKILLLMILGHLISDYTLQGWLADGKQRSWWNERLHGLPSEIQAKYQYDYIAALICHSFYWSIITFLPVHDMVGWPTIVLLNAAVHCVIDDLKANRLKINLCVDQLLHLAQIVGVWLASFVF